VAAELDYPLQDVPEPGGARPLAPGMLWARLPVPGPLRHINVWLLDDGDGWMLVDTGMNTAESRAAWDGPLLAPLEGRPLRRILCTHHHPDHAGLAKHLGDRHGAEILVSAGEHAVMRRIEHAWSDEAAAEARCDAVRAEGVVVEGDMRVLIRLERYRGVMSGIPAGMTHVADGDVLETGRRRWTARVLGGHTDAQLVLHCERDGLLISADQVLPRITSNVGIYPERADLDPVASYLSSFDVLDELPADTLVLPAHGNPFRGLRTRVAHLRAHHLETLEKIVGMLDEPATATELASRLFVRPLDVLNTYLAVGETLAHVRRLVHAGAATIDETSPRRYVRAAA
jgi:glyoxylase-like metal-dependent hydrolase (beta-lactamase superfamily II)